MPLIAFGDAISKDNQDIVKNLLKNQKAKKISNGTICGSTIPQKYVQMSHKEAKDRRRRQRKLDA